MMGKTKSARKLMKQTLMKKSFVMMIPDLI